MDNQQPPQTPPEVIVPQPKPNYLKTIIFSFLIIFTLSLIAYLVFQNQKLQKQVLNPPVSPTVQAPSPASQSVSPTSKSVSSISISPDETAEWKTYESSKFGFSFRYPQSSIMKIDNLGIDGSLEFDNFILFVEKTIDTLTNYVNRLKDTNGVSPVTKNIGNMQTIEWVGSFKNAPTHYLSIENRGYVYSFGVTPLDDMTSFNPNDTNLLNQILSTFKFTN